MVSISSILASAVRSYPMEPSAWSRPPSWTGTRIWLAWKWKRKVHAEHDTTLIETYSYERQEGRLLIALAEKVAPHVTLMPRQADTIFDRVVEMAQVDTFSQLLATFLRKFKSGGYSLADCDAKAEQMKLGKRGKAFLAVFAPSSPSIRSGLAERSTSRTWSCGPRIIPRQPIM